MKKLLRSLIGKPQRAFDPHALCDHRWQVVSTVLDEVALQVQCQKCGLFGSVPNPSEDEWADAFDAPDNPYDWDDPERVETAFQTVGEWMEAAIKPSG